VASGLSPDSRLVWNTGGDSLTFTVTIQGRQQPLTVPAMWDGKPTSIAVWSHQGGPGRPPQPDSGARLRLWSPWIAGTRGQIAQMFIGVGDSGSGIRVYRNGGKVDTVAFGLLWPLIWPNDSSLVALRFGALSDTTWIDLIDPRHASRRTFAILPYRCQEEYLGIAIDLTQALCVVKETTSDVYLQTLGAGDSR
jgi:hypothetical protein